MPDLTPVRVRGKRKAIPAEKWNYGKQHKVRKTESASSSARHSSSQRSSPAGASPSKKKRNPRTRQLSRLEELPTEVIQFIFELSENLDLPSVSPQLALPLQSAHLQQQLTSRILEPVLGQQGHGVSRLPIDPSFDPSKACKAAELAAATRLMDSKFFTYSFVKDWLHRQFEQRDPDESCLHRPRLDAGSESLSKRTWADLRPSCNLLPPRKLLIAPFNDEKLRMLELIISYALPRTLADEHPSLHELASGALRHAVADKSTRALSAFWHIGLKPDMGLLRQAIVDEDCDRKVVYSIIWYAYIFCPSSDIEWLDPQLWSWAAKAEVRGDARGAWLKEILRHCGKTKDVPTEKMTDYTSFFRRYLTEQPEEAFGEEYREACCARDFAAREAYNLRSEFSD